MSDNKEIFESLYHEYHPMVLQLCRGYMKGDVDLARDLVQEVFINTWSALQKFRNEAAYRTWIYRITVNTCLNYIRDRKNKLSFQINEDQYACPAEETTFSSEKHHEILYHAIGQLKEVDRLIIMMVLDELAYEEISTIMGMSEGAVRVRISRIKKKLKKIMENG
jgi:RNA polymerase sigma-70 factor (ECF subfamily)